MLFRNSNKILLTNFCKIVKILKFLGINCWNLTSAYITLIKQMKLLEQPISQWKFQSQQMWIQFLLSLFPFPFLIFLCSYNYASVSNKLESAIWIPSNMFFPFWVCFIKKLENFRQENKFSGNKELGFHKKHFTLIVYSAPSKHLTLISPIPMVFPLIIYKCFSNNTFCILTKHKIISKKTIYFSRNIFVHSNHTLKLNSTTTTKNLIN